jgi:hypothetical protein
MGGIPLDADFHIARQPQFPHKHALDRPRPDLPMVAFELLEIVGFGELQVADVVVGAFARKMLNDLALPPKEKLVVVASLV